MSLQSFHNLKISKRTVFFARRFPFSAAMIPARGALLQRHNAQLRDAVECNRLMLTVIEQFKQVPNSPLNPTYGPPLDSDITTPAKQVSFLIPMSLLLSGP